jgi:adenylate cyclase
MPNRFAGEPRLLTADQLAIEAGSTPEYVDELTAAGMLEREVDGRHRAGDVRLVRLALALRGGGIETDDLVWAIESSHLPLAAVAPTWPTPGPANETFEAFASSLGALGERLPAVYAAFGLAEPDPTSAIPEREEAIVREFLETWALVDERRDVAVRAARIAGEGVRRIQEATLDLFDEAEGSPPQRLARGLSIEEAARPSAQLNDVMGRLLPWLIERHSEDEVFRRIVGYIENHAERAGRVAPRVGVQPAIAFVDLAGYTRFTETAGDHEAAAIATALQDMASETAREHGGRVVKLLGDGVMLRFPSAVDAVRAVLALMTGIEGRAMPRAHAGVASGRVVVRDADVYGHTVNLAARIAGHASVGDLLVPADLAAALQEAGIGVEDAGVATLKGIGDAVALARVLRPGG